MEIIFDTAIFNRKLMRSFLEELTHEQLTKIPSNFNNSIFWNIAHVLVTQQLLSYKLSGLPININKGLVKKYAKGSSASTDVSMEEIAYVKEHLISTVLKTKEDYNMGIFKLYEPYLTSVDISLNNIDDALKFNAFHDGIHLGVVLSIKKLV